jgi:hypothetical protein
MEILLDSWTNDEQHKVCMYGQMMSLLPSWDFMSYSCGFAK